MFRRKKKIIKFTKVIIKFQDGQVSDFNNVVLLFRDKGFLYVEFENEGISFNENCIMTVTYKFEEEETEN